jgi:hypothetical protein
MAKVIFTRKFEFDFRPRLAVCQCFEPSDTPQDVTRDVRDAAIAAGAARDHDASRKRRKPDNRGGSPQL